jgi:hypothetical protein
VKNRKTPLNKKASITPAAREHELILLLRQLHELYPMTQFIEKSYLVSRFWAWFTQIEVNPQVRIPVPRFLSYRDP